jgi:hypothetical protein
MNLIKMNLIKIVMALDLWQVEKIAFCNPQKWWMRRDIFEIKIIVSLLWFELNQNGKYSFVEFIVTNETEKMVYLYQLYH